MNKKEGFGLDDRMKRYEDAYRHYLPYGIPKILRLDGKAFHSVLKYAVKPFDMDVIANMAEVAYTIIREIGGTARFAYIQSDEISIAINDYMKLNSMT